MFRKWKEARNNEKGNSMILTLMFIPTAVISFGLAIDFSIYVYTQSNIQHSLDTAAVAYASALKGIGTEGNALNLYKENVQQIKGFLDCDGDTCGNNAYVSGKTSNEVTIAVDEKIHYVVLPTLAGNSKEALGGLVDKMSNLTVKSTAQIK